MADIADRQTVTDRADDDAPGRRSVPRWVVTVAALPLFMSFWEYFGRDINPIFGSYPSAIFAAFVDLARSGKL